MYVVQKSVFINGDRVVGKTKLPSKYQMKDY